MNKKFYFFIFLFLSCNLNEMNRIEESEKNKTYLNLKNFFKEAVLKETSTKNAIKRGSAFSSVFYIDTEDIKKIDGIDPSLYQDKLPSQVSVTPSLKPERNRNLRGIKVKLKEGLIEKNDKAGSYSYQVILNKNGKEEEIKITYFFQNTSSYWSKVLFDITPSDIDKLDNIDGDILKLPTHSSVPSTPSFDDFLIDGVKLQTKLVKFGNGDNVRRSDREGKYEYKVHIGYDDKIYREFVVYYRFQSKSEKEYSKIDPKIQDDLEESLFNSITESDIKSRDGLTFISTDKPTSKGSPAFNAAGYNLRSLKSVVFSLVGGSVQKNDGLGSYSYEVEVRYSLSSRSRSLSKRIRVTYVVNSEISKLTENDIKAVDGITPSPLSLASSASNPPVFDTRGGVGGVTGVVLSLVGNPRILDSSGIYEYKVKVSKGGKEKTLNIAYSGFETTQERRERLDKVNLRSITVADIKGIDSITVDAAVLPSAVGSPSFSIPVGGLRGLSNLTISATSITKTDNAGTYAYNANLEKHGEKRTLAISYTGYKNTLTAAQERDLSRLNNFTEAEIKSMDDITVDGAVLPPSKDPTFTRKNLHGFGDTEYTMSLVAGTKSKNDAAGTYSYRVRLSSVATSQTRDVDILYSGFLTAAQKILNDDHLKIASFSAADIKQWDGINVSASVYATSLPDQPTFTLPAGAYKGLTGFKVEFQGAASAKNDRTGSYSYEVLLKNAAETVSKTIEVSYTGFATIAMERAQIDQFTEADLKQWDGITSDITILGSTLTPNFTLPGTYKGLSNFKVKLLGIPLKDDDLGTYRYIAEVRNSSGQFRKVLVVSYVGSFKPKIYIDMADYKTITDHTDKVFSVSYSPDGTKFASSSGDDTIKIWNADTGDLIKTFTAAGSGDFNSISYSPDGTKIVSGSDDHKIRIWNSTKGTVIKTLTGHTGNVSSVSYSLDGTKIVSGSSDSTVKLWNSNRGNTPIYTYDRFDGNYFIRSAVFSPDGTYVLIAQRIDFYIFNVNTLVRDYQSNRMGHTSSNAVFSPDGQYGVGAQAPTKDLPNFIIIHFWKLNKGKFTKQKSITNPHSGNHVRFISYSPDGTKIATGSTNGEIKIWDVATSSLIKVLLNSHTDEVRSIVFSPDGKQIISGSVDKTIKIWK